MKSRGGRFLLFLGAGLAVMAFAVVYIVMSRGSLGSPTSSPSVPEAVQMASVVVVNQDVPAYTMLSAANLATTEVEASTAVSNTTSEPSSYYGKMTLVPLTKGQQIQSNLLTESGFSSVLSKGERAFSLAVPERSTFGAAVTENDRIDVLWTANLVYYEKVPQADGKFTYEQRIYTSTKTILQDVRVLRVISLRVAVPQSQQADNGQAEQTVARTPGATTPAMYEAGAPFQAVLIVAVNDQAAEVLKFARENGVLDMTLRASGAMRDGSGNVIKDASGKDVMGDHDIEQTTGIAIQELVEKYGMPVPKVAP
jgi:Flp pilus assembly protein CpaB